MFDVNENCEKLEKSRFKIVELMPFNDDGFNMIFIIIYSMKQYGQFMYFS